MYRINIKTKLIDSVVLIQIELYKKKQWLCRYINVFKLKEKIKKKSEVNYGEM